MNETDTAGRRPDDPMNATQAPGVATPETKPDAYAIVEIFGHRQHVGRILEVEQFGAKMLRVDVPKDGDFAQGYVSHFYGGASIFSMTPTDLATVQRMNKSSAPPALSYRAYDPDDDPNDASGTDEDAGLEPLSPYTDAEMTTGLSAAPAAEDPGCGEG